MVTVPEMVQTATPVELRAPRPGEQGLAWCCSRARTKPSSRTSRNSPPTPVRQGSISVGNSGPGNSHLTTSAFAAIRPCIKTKFTIQYKGSGPALIRRLIGGHVDGLRARPEFATHVEGGELQTLAVLADKRQRSARTCRRSKENGIDQSIGTPASGRCAQRDAQGGARTCRRVRKSEARRNSACSTPSTHWPRKPQMPTKAD